MLTCPNCARESPDGFAFCPACASPLETPSPSREVRKTVTVVFCDVTGSTAIGERLDPESLRRVMSRYFSEMRTALERHGGTVEKFIGDAVMAVFGIPVVHEDDALRAVRAAEEMRQALALLRKELERDHGVTLAARIGVNTGKVVAGEGTSQTLVTGDAVNVAARLEQAASPDEVLIGAETLRLVRDGVVVEAVEPLELKGKAEPVTAFRLIEVTAGAVGVARRLDSPMVGRERQLAQLRQAFDAAAADRSCQLFTVLGTPGVGKSRVVEEFLGTIGDRAMILRGRCLPYGDGITFFPIGEVVKQAAGLEDFDSQEEIEQKICAIFGEDEGGEHTAACARLAQLFGLTGDEAAPEETFWAIRRFLESLARASPLAIVFDDVHWGEPTFLDTIEHIAEWSRDAPILVLCMARPELLDERPAWGGGKLNAATISLGPLSDAECTALIANLLGRAALPDDAEARILEAAEGTPLFVEEMLSMLIDDGLLARDDGSWVARGDLSEVPVPATIRALLAARLDRLGPEEREVIERAAVAGKQFHLGAVAAQFGDDPPANLRATLMNLVRRDLIGPDRSLLAGEDAFRFRHLLIRDAAYEAIPKALRADLHERFADWLLGVAGNRVEEQEEIVGYHLEQAYRLRGELGPVGDASAGIALRAAGHLEASGRRAAERGDPEAAANLLRRAIDLLPDDHPDRPRLLYELADELGSVGDVRAMLSVWDEAVTRAAAAGQTSLEWLARIQRSEVRQLADPHAMSTHDVRVELDEAVGVFERLQDDAALATAWKLHAHAEWMPCRFAAAERAATRAAEHARRAGDRRLLESALIIRSAAQYFGTTPPQEALETLDNDESEIGNTGRFRYSAPVHRGAHTALLGNFEQARRLLDQARELAEIAGTWAWVSGAIGAQGELERQAGNLHAAEQAMRENYRLLDEHGDEGHRSTAAGDLALVLCDLGSFDEGETFARIALDAAAEDDLASQVTGRSAQARVHSARGRHDQAISLAREAVEMFANAEAPDHQGDIRMELARALRAAGRPQEAIVAAREALGFYEQKGNVPAVAISRTFIGVSKE